MKGSPQLRRLMIGAAAIAILPNAAAFAAAPGDAAATPGQCSLAAIQALAPSDTTITAAVSVATPVPNCKVEGYVTTTNPGPNRVVFRLQLPDQGWQHRYYFIGMGGAAGYVPTDSQIPAGNPLYKGFAVAGTDTGHTGAMLDWSFMGKSPAQAMDHIHRGAHVVAVSTQQITRRYYKTDKLYRYHCGCSGGGRMGVMAIERHPEDFDGVLLGAPGGRSSATMIKFIAAAQESMREPGAWVSPAKLMMAEAKVTAACDMTDGARDGIVADHRLCKFDVATLACNGPDGPECLTQPEIRTIKAIIRGPLGPDGRPLTEGMPITNMSTWAGFTGRTPPPWSADPNEVMRGKGSSGLVIANTLAQSYFGPNYDAVKQFNSRNPADLKAWRDAAVRLDYGQPYTANLRGYQRSGGKLILYNGVSDPCCSDIELEQYYHDAGMYVAGGPAALPKFIRYYRVPGMSHCGGGTGPGDAPDQMLDSLIAWVERGIAPAQIVAHRGADRVQLQFADPKTRMVSGVLVPPPAGPSRDFLLCPLPQVAVFNGSTAANAAFDASNWSCKTNRNARLSSADSRPQG
jgi:feruloyl esterase